MQSKNIDWYDRCIKLLSFRPRGVSEIRQYLTRHKVSSFETEKVISRLLDEKFLDDREFAAWWMEQRSTFRPKASRIIAYELKQKGIASDIISQTVETVSSEQEMEIVTGLAQKKWPKLVRYEKPEREEKLISYLLRRGFSYPMAKKALTCVVDAASQTE